MQASDRFNINSQLEHLQAKYVGTGHADLNRLSVSLSLFSPKFILNFLFFVFNFCLFFLVLWVCSEWAVNIQRDSYASYIGHYPLLAYVGIAENESIGRERYNFMQVFFLSISTTLFHCHLSKG